VPKQQTVLADDHDDSPGRQHAPELGEQRGWTFSVVERLGQESKVK